MRNTVGAWDRIGGEKRELKSLRMFLTNREMFNYFREAIVVHSHKLFGAIGKKLHGRGIYLYPGGGGGPPVNTSGCFQQGVRFTFCCFTYDPRRI